MESKSKIEEVRRLFDQFEMNLNLLEESSFGRNREDELIQLDFHSASYLCILLCGAIEQDVLRILRDYVASSWPEEASKFFERRDNRIALNPSDIKGFAVRVNEEWKNRMGNLLNTESEAYSAITTIKGHRNLIAHGRGSELNRTVKRRMENLKIYLSRIEDFLMEFSEIVGGIKK